MVTVPEGQYFFLGDNRDNVGRFSRYDVGFVPAENLVGKAQVIFLSVFEEGTSPWQVWRWPHDTCAWDRLFDTVVVPVALERPALRRTALNAEPARARARGAGGPPSSRRTAPG